MRLWLSVTAVTLANAVLKAGGPLMFGQRPLPDLAARIAALTAPVLLAGLIVTALGGTGWGQLDLAQILGVGVAGAARVARAPMLLALLCGVAATALLR